MTPRPRLRLRARDEEDLAIVAACLQDARVPPREMCFLAAEGRFMAAFTRFQRERPPVAGDCDGGGLMQCRAALVFQRVAAVQHRGLDGLGDATELELLTIVADAEPAGAADGRPIEITLLFAGGAAIRLRVTAVDGCLEEFGEPWRAAVTPRDHFAAAAAVAAEG